MKYLFQGKENIRLQVGVYNQIESRWNGWEVQGKACGKRCEGIAIKSFKQIVDILDQRKRKKSKSLQREKEDDRRDLKRDGGGRSKERGRRDKLSHLTNEGRRGEEPVSWNCCWSSRGCCQLSIVKGLTCPINLCLFLKSDTSRTRRVLNWTHLDTNWISFIIFKNLFCGLYVIWNFFNDARCLLLAFLDLYWILFSLTSLFGLIFDLFSL